MPEMRADRQARDAVCHQEVRAEEMLEMQAEHQTRDAECHEVVRAEEMPEIQAECHPTRQGMLCTSRK